MDAAEGLVWDRGNRAHLAERNAQRVAAGEEPISEAECDALFASGRWIWRWHEYRTREGEWVAQRRLIGRTPEGRFLTLACDLTEDGAYRPATVWESSPRERARYRRERRPREPRRNQEDDGP